MEERYELLDPTVLLKLVPVYHNVRARLHQLFFRMYNIPVFKACIDVKGQYEAIVKSQRFRNKFQREFFLNNDTQFKFELFNKVSLLMMIDLGHKIISRLSDTIGPRLVGGLREKSRKNRKRNQKTHKINDSIFWKYVRRLQRGGVHNIVSASSPNTYNLNNEDDRAIHEFVSNFNYNGVLGTYGHEEINQFLFGRIFNSFQQEELKSKPDDVLCISYILQLVQHIVIGSVPFELFELSESKQVGGGPLSVAFTAVVLFLQSLVGVFGESMSQSQIVQTNTSLVSPISSAIRNLDIMCETAGPSVQKAFKVGQVRNSNGQMCYLSEPLPQVEESEHYCVVDPSMIKVFRSVHAASLLNPRVPEFSNAFVCDQGMMRSNETIVTSFHRGTTPLPTSLAGATVPENILMSNHLHPWDIDRFNSHFSGADLMSVTHSTIYRGILYGSAMAPEGMYRYSFTRRFLTQFSEIYKSNNLSINQRTIMTNSIHSKIKELIKEREISALQCGILESRSITSYRGLGEINVIVPANNGKRETTVTLNVGFDIEFYNQELLSSGFKMPFDKYNIFSIKTDPYFGGFNPVVKATPGISSRQLFINILREVFENFPTSVNSSVPKLKNLPAGAASVVNSEMPVADIFLTLDMSIVAKSLERSASYRELQQQLRKLQLAKLKELVNSTRRPMPLGKIVRYIPNNSAVVPVEEKRKTVREIIIDIARWWIWS
jgi:hypothetical protein